MSRPGLNSPSTSDLACYFASPDEIMSLCTDEGLLAKLHAAWELARSLRDAQFERDACKAPAWQKIDVVVAPATAPKKHATPLLICCAVLRI